MPVMARTQPKQSDWKNPTSRVITLVLALRVTRWTLTAATRVITMNIAAAVKNQVKIAIAVMHLMPSVLEVLVLEDGGRTIDRSTAEISNFMAGRDLRYSVNTSMNRKLISMLDISGWKKNTVLQSPGLG